MTIATSVLCALLGYLLGAIPTGVLVGRLWHGVDVRNSGSTHTGGLNVYRTTGNLWAGVLTGLVDVGLAVLAVLLARIWSADPWAPPLAAVMAIIGHNWSVFIRLRGGVGMSTLFGSMAALSLPVALILVAVLAAIWLLVNRILRHGARSSIVIMLLVSPLLWLLCQPTPLFALGTLGALPVILKELGDFNRVYDRE